MPEDIIREGTFKGVTKKMAEASTSHARNVIKKIDAKELAGGAGFPSQHVEVISPGVAESPRLGGFLRDHPYALPLALGAGVVGGYEVAHLAGAGGSGNLAQDASKDTGNIVGGAFGALLSGLLGISPQQGKAFTQLLFVAAIILLVVFVFHKARGK